MGTLQRLLLRPGNARMCGPTPANLSFQGECACAVPVHVQD